MPRAVVFTHFVMPQGADDLLGRGQRRIVHQECERLIGSYQACPSIGLVYVFIADGYQAILAGKEPWRALDRERRLRRMFARHIGAAGATKFQIVGTRELTPTLAALARLAGPQLARLLLGGGRRMYYDSPKFVEAVIRLARGFRPEPIFRFDADVMVNEQAVQNLRGFHRRLQERGLYFFSGGYACYPPTMNQKRLLNDYAVRVHHLSDRCRGRYVVNEPVAERFLDELQQVGADQRCQVISGAGLCMSFQAIFALPPFANVGGQIVWIDDHLKRRLHEQVGQLDHNRNCRCSKANFLQHRYPAGVASGDVKWARNQYLPRLARGSVMDALIWDRRADAPGPLADLVDSYLKNPLRGPPSRNMLQQRLTAPAQARLDELIALWRQPHYRRYGPFGFAGRLASGANDRLVRQAIDAADQYFKLLDMWPRLAGAVLLLDREDPGNRWLFRQPV